MANPLSLFRKHQRLLMGVSGVLIIFSFTVGGVITQCQGTAPSGVGQRQNETVVTWTGGEIREDELQQMRYSHFNVIRYLRAISAKVGKDVQPKVTPIRPATSEKEIFEKRLLAAKAKEMGLAISDSAIIDYLTKYSDDQLLPADLLAIRRETFRDTVSEQELFDQFRIELMAQKLEQLANAPRTTLTPSSAWHYHNRTERQVVAQVLPLELAQYRGNVISEVGEPSNAQLKEVYEKYKTEYPSPERWEPAFKRPRKFAIEALKADYEVFLDAAKKAIPMKDVVAAYEARIANGEFEDKSSGLDDIPVPEPSPSSGDEPETDEPAPEDKKPAPEDKKPAPEDGGSLLNPGETFVALQDGAEAKEDDTPAKDDPAEKADDTKKDDTPAAGDDKPADEKPAEPAAEEKPKKFLPLEKVEDTLRSALVQELKEDVRKKMEDTIKAVKRRMRDYYNTRLRAAARKKELPAPISLKSLAKEFPQLTYSQTKLLDRIEFAKTELGKANSTLFYIIRSARGMQPYPMREFTLADLAYNEQLVSDSADLRFSPDEFADRIAQGGYEMKSDVIHLYWRTEVEAAEVPEFEDIRDQVREAWIDLEARKLAEKAARAKAEQAAGDKTLKELFPDEVEETGEFKWLVPPSFSAGAFGAENTSRTPRLNKNVENVEDPGNDFMQATFALAPGETGVAWNEDHSVCYAIEVQKDVVDADQRLETFFTSWGEASPANEYSGMVYDENLELQRTWYDNLNDEMKVTWQREPSIFSR